MRSSSLALLCKHLNHRSGKTFPQHTGKLAYTHLISCSSAHFFICFVSSFLSFSSPFQIYAVPQKAGAKHQPNQVPRSSLGHRDTDRPPTDHLSSQALSHLRGERRRGGLSHPGGPCWLRAPHRCLGENDWVWWFCLMGFKEVLFPKF